MAQLSSPRPVPAISTLSKAQTDPYMKQAKSMHWVRFLAFDPLGLGSMYCRVQRFSYFYLCRRGECLLRYIVTNCTQYRRSPIFTGIFGRFQALNRGHTMMRIPIKSLAANTIFFTLWARKRFWDSKTTGGPHGFNEEEGNK